MPTALQLRRGSTSQNNSFTGAVGEVSVDTDKDTLRVHDGSTAGGFEVVTTTATQTLTNKTLTSPNISGASFTGASFTFEGASDDSFETTLTVTDPTADRTVTIPNATTTLVGRDTTDTLTNKTLTTPVINEIDGSTITLDASADVNIDAGGGDIILKDDGTEFGRLTNNAGQLLIKSSSSSTTALSLNGANVTVAGNLTVSGTTTTVDSSTVNLQTGFIFEGSSDDSFETTLTATDPTADRTITLPNLTGTVSLITAAETLTNKTLT